MRLEGGSKAAFSTIEGATIARGRRSTDVREKLSLPSLTTYRFDIATEQLYSLELSRGGEPSAYSFGDFQSTPRIANPATTITTTKPDERHVKAIDAYLYTGRDLEPDQTTPTMGLRSYLRMKQSPSEQHQSMDTDKERHCRSDKGQQSTAQSSMVLLRIWTHPTYSAGNHLVRGGISTTSQIPLPIHSYKQQGRRPPR
jgi:hypothetical protein